MSEHATEKLVFESAGVSAGYGRLEVISDISLQVCEGETVALLGANGAGKSTFLNTMAGAIKARSGQMTFRGVDVTSARPRRMVDLGLGYVAENRRLFKSLTVEDNLVLGLHRSRCTGPDVRLRTDSMYELFPVLATRRSMPAGALSGGQQQSLAIAQGLISYPAMLVIDELSFGLAPAIVDEIIDVLVKARGHVGSMLIVEQSIERVLSVADRVFVVRAGRLSDSGSAADFRDQARLNQAYFGGDGTLSSPSKRFPGAP